MDDNYYMQMALEEARRAGERNEIPIGAVIVATGQPSHETKGKENSACAGPLSYARVIARAHNLTETLNDPTAHAEMQAITAATEYLGGKYLTGCTLYVTVEPCPMCAAALAWAQCSRIVYGADDPRRGYSLFSPSLLHPRTQVTKGILADECAALMTEFFKARRK